MSERMFQSGLSRLRSVLSGGTGGTGEVQDRERRHSAVVRSSSQNPRSDLARQILSKVSTADIFIDIPASIPATYII